ncbi:TetR/AcrR family transcriptional regulator [Paenibacillus glycanilyticus]|uniref:TetR/AcrR family transcriptional regulator n=1 Tax=Paenibacillus glycanilyticus TaxID=126569 RepID=UPI00204265AA|nr:TetR/AcrR family transcriptional regulator [Paenibacillus glycanilyticus]MCM3628502.1 TetR/AcrR family transcriptional regulator [Paenibacillus glycanilyticus]
MNENDLRIVKTKRALHQALLALLKKQTLESISVSTLCREAGVNRGTFYLHYNDVGALFDEHLNHLLKDLEESYYEPYKHVTEMNHTLLDPATIRIFHHVKKYQPFYEIVFDKKSSISYYYSLFEKIKGLMIESTGSSGTSNTFVIAYLVNAIMGLLIQWNEEGFSQTPEYMSEQLSSILKSMYQKPVH